jgi:hypothetical protein
MFSTPADLGIVAYAQINGDGTSPDLNSGVTVTHVSQGVYDVTLPGDPSLQEPLQEGQKKSASAYPTRDMILVTAYEPTPRFYSIQVTSDFTQRISFWDNTVTLADTIFAILILRSLISPPQDAQGNYIAPA